MLDIDLTLRTQRDCVHLQSETRLHCHTIKIKHCYTYTHFLSSFHDMSTRLAQFRPSSSAVAKRRNINTVPRKSTTTTNTIQRTKAAFASVSRQSTPLSPAALALKQRLATALKHSRFDPVDYERRRIKGKSVTAIQNILSLVAVRRASAPTGRAVLVAITHPCRQTKNLALLSDKEKQRIMDGWDIRRKTSSRATTVASPLTL